MIAPPAQVWGSVWKGRNEMSFQSLRLRAELLRALAEQG